MDGFEAADASAGIKKLDDEALQAYRQRIEELTAFMWNGRADPAAIVEWLVRCAEDPATRREGAYELAQGVWQLQEEEESKSDAAEPEQDEKTAPDQPDGTGKDKEEVEEEEPNFATLLTNAQKHRLTDALFRTRKLSEQDVELLEIVRSFKDPRFVPFLVGQLRLLAADALYEAGEVISILTEELDDEEIGKLFEEYELVSDAGDGNDPDSPNSPDSEDGRAKRREVILRFLAAVERKLDPRN